MKLNRTLSMLLVAVPSLTLLPCVHEQPLTITEATAAPAE